MRVKLPTLIIWTLAAVLAAGVLPALAGDVPAVLPDPDGKPGEATKPVKVYILAGQSNMVGMGNLSGATNRYTGVFLTSDMAAPVGAMGVYRVGNYKIAHCTVYLPDGTKTGKPIAQGLLDVPGSGVYGVNCASGGVTFAAMGFLRSSHPRIKPYPPQEHFTLWLEEQKLPPLDLEQTGK